MTVARKVAVFADFVQWTSETADDLIQALTEEMDVTAWRETDSSIGVLVGGDAKALRPRGIILRVHDSIVVISDDDADDFLRDQGVYR